MPDWNIKKLLNWSIDYLKDREFETPRLDAEILLAYSLGIRRLDLYLQFERPLQSQELSLYKTLIKRRVNHEPVAYIVGKKEFWSRDFFVTPDVLIPRPDTEILIEVILKNFRENKSEISGFEMGLGSGALAITLLSEMPLLKMTAVEISPKAVEIAHRNAAYHGISGRLNLIAEDFLKYSRDNPNNGSAFDFVCTNPPYCKSSCLSTLPRSVKDYEPVSALDGGENGLKYYPEIITFAKRHLKPGGLLVTEIGEDQGAAVIKLFKDYGFDNTYIKRDYNGLDRVVGGNQP
ncbi:MAG: peptide chain release factor N(5)-glutamine methyltransferase [Deltaproteobacteria bacterium]|nr:peptide chain release factor N(5)-glutamine methyltransferase [Deltaproteobacteria bacterium]